MQPESDKMKAPSTSVKELRGCGEVTYTRLKNAGVLTYQDLLDFRGKVEGVNIERFKAVARRELDAKPLLLSKYPEISGHTWSGRYAHVLVTDGKVRRARIGALVVAPHHVALQVSWEQGKRVVQKSVTPVAILSYETLWHSHDIISDDDDDNENDEDLNSILPILRINDDDFAALSLSAPQAEGVKAALKETNQLHAHMYANMNAEVS